MPSPSPAVLWFVNVCERKPRKKKKINQVNVIISTFFSEWKFLSFFYNFDVESFYTFLFVQKTKKNKKIKKKLGECFCLSLLLFKKPLHVIVQISISIRLLEKVTSVLVFTWYIKWHKFFIFWFFIFFILGLLSVTKHHAFCTFKTNFQAKLSGPVDQKCSWILPVSIDIYSHISDDWSLKISKAMLIVTSEFLNSLVGGYLMS